MFRGLIRTLRRKEAGFTLIELMIVILVILILAAILLPQFGVARERARKAQCVSNQRNLETAVAMWVEDNPFSILARGQMNASSIPNIVSLTGAVPYTTTAMFKEPDDAAATGTSGADYYLSSGAPTGSPANQLAPSYGHVSCAADGVPDPWVAGYDGSIPATVTGIRHTRGGSASP